MKKKQTLLEKHSKLFRAGVRKKPSNVGESFMDYGGEQSKMP